MIIIEGPDNAGKSVLADKISKLISWEVVHSVKITLDNYAQEDKEFMAYMNAIRHLNPERIIRDRTYAISENVYGPIIRGKSLLGVYSGRALHSLANTQCMIIYCRPPTKFILDNNDRDQMDGVIKNHLQLVEKYDSMFSVLDTAGAFVHRYDYTDSLAWNKLSKSIISHVQLFNIAKDEIHEFTKRS
ncbi:thymidylate kinase [Yersinia phage vB_YenM_P744]